MLARPVGLPCARRTSSISTALRAHELAGQQVDDPLARAAALEAGPRQHVVDVLAPGLRPGRRGRHRRAFHTDAELSPRAGKAGIIPRLSLIFVVGCPPTMRLAARPPRGTTPGADRRRLRRDLERDHNRRQRRRRRELLGLDRQADRRRQSRRAEHHHQPGAGPALLRADRERRARDGDVPARDRQRRRLRPVGAEAAGRESRRRPDRADRRQPVRAARGRQPAPLVRPRRGRNGREHDRRRPRASSIPSMPATTRANSRTSRPAASRNTTP